MKTTKEEKIKQARASMEKFIATLPPEDQDKARKAMQDSFDLAERALPMVDRATKDLPTEEFNKEYRKIAEMARDEVKPDKESQVMPKLLVQSTKDEDGNRRGTFIVIAGEMTSEDKHEIIQGIGTKMGVETIEEIAAVYMIAEAWQSSYDPKDKSDQLPPSQRADRREILTVAALTTDGRAAQYLVPIRRTKSGVRKPVRAEEQYVDYDPNSKKPDVEPEILTRFMTGYIVGRMDNGRTKN